MQVQAHRQALRVMLVSRIIRTIMMMLLMVTIQKSKIDV